MNFNAFKICTSFFKTLVVRQIWAFGVKDCLLIGAFLLVSCAHANESFNIGIAEGLPTEIKQVQEHFYRQLFANLPFEPVFTVMPKHRAIKQLNEEQLDAIELAYDDGSFNKVIKIEEPVLTVRSGLFCSDKKTVT